MIKQQFYEAVDQLYARIRETQNDNIRQAAEMIAESVTHDGCVHLFDTGHIIDSEIFNRAGGFELMRRFRYNLDLVSAARPRAERSEKEKSCSLEGLAELALNKGDVLPGDVMIIGSVSGKTVNVIDLALACRERGIKVIAVTSVTYSSQVESMHSSGKRLYELADVVLDNCAPYGDAMLDIDGLDAPFIPASGLAAAYIMWGVNADLAEVLLDKGVQPSILRSVNYEPNRIYNKELGERYQKEGY